MANYLTEEELERAQRLLQLFYSLPFGVGLVGPVWEQILARIKGGEWTGKRDNRPNPDIVIGGKNISVKTEGINKLTRTRRRAVDFLGHHEDLIIARPPVDQFLAAAELHSLSANELGTLVLNAYNNIVTQYRWDTISILLRLDKVETKEFIYWEEPPVLYDPTDYEWIDSSKSSGRSRNINTVPSPAKFKWNSRGSQFYIDYTIPRDADIITVECRSISVEELLDLLESLADT